MKRTRKGKRILAVTLSVLLAVSCLPAVTYAEKQTVHEEGICQHHSQHTADCGYEVGQPCEHEHMAECYTDELICGYIEDLDADLEEIATDSEAGHVHEQDCYKLDCPHKQGEHDSQCSFEETSPCGYFCELCGEIGNDPEVTPDNGGKRLPCTLTEDCVLTEGHIGSCITKATPSDGIFVKNITGWKYVGNDYLDEGELAIPGINKDNPADFDMVVSMLPSALLAEIEDETETVQVDITDWSCPQYKKDADENWPVAGDFIFTAVLQEEYSCDPLPTVNVRLGGAAVYTENTSCDFTVTGNGSYQFADSVLTIESNSVLTIKNTNPDTPAEHRIKVADGADNVHITLSGVNIDLYHAPQNCAFDIANATVELTLAEGTTNILKSGVYRAGLEVLSNGNLTIGGSGTLIAESICGAGIGGFGEHNDGHCGSITIKEKADVTALSEYGAGIGGGGKETADSKGDCGNGGIILIQDEANVTAQSIRGAGIGGGSVASAGNGGNGGKVTINGGTVIAQSTGNDRAIGMGAGIGGGAGSEGNSGEYNGGNGGIVIINGGTVTASSGGNGAGIGGGGGANGRHGGNGGDITITGGEVTASSAWNGAGIGGGGGGVCDESNGGNGGSGGTIIISGGKVTAISNGQTEGVNYTGIGRGAAIGGGGGEGVHADKIGAGGEGAVVKISGSNTHVTACGGTDNISGFDIGGGAGVNANDTKYGSSGSLSVTDGATLVMKNKGTNVSNPEYKDCTITDNAGNEIKYGSSGSPIASPTLSLSADPQGSQTLPGKVTLTAALKDAFPNNSGKTITFTIGSSTALAETNDEGNAVCTISNLSQGTYTIKASFPGDGDNNKAEANSLEGYTINLGTQKTLTLNGFNTTYTYGCEDFTLSTSGGSGNGNVTFTSSDTSVATVTNDQVTIHKAGEFILTAVKATDNIYAETTATSGTIKVSPATPNINLTAAGGSDINTPITLTATVSAVGNGAVPTGTVAFCDGDKLLASDIPLNQSGEAIFQITRPTAGSHAYTAVYSGNNDHYTENRVTRTIVIGLANQTGFVINTPGTKTYGDDPFDLKATGGQSTGSVSFSVPQNNGVLAVAESGTANIIGAGKVLVTATKAGDSNYNDTSASLEITVSPRSISNITVSVTGNRVYTGSQLQPVFEVKDGNTAITIGDFTNSYGANVETGAEMGSITLTGQHNYTGTKTIRFDIEKRALAGASITLEPGPYNRTRNGVTPAVTNVVVDRITVPAIAFDVGYANNTDIGTATVTITAKSDSNFSGAASTTFEITKSSNGSSSDNSDSVSTPKTSYLFTGNSISQSIFRSDLKQLADSGKTIKLQSGSVQMTFNPAALKSILAAVPATVSSITFSAAPADLSPYPAAAALIGSRPVYDFNISYKDSNGNNATVKVYFPPGSSSIALNYSPASTEAEGNLFLVYVDSNGAVTWLDKSSYTGGRILADAPHFSIYGTAYKASAPVYTDTQNHWAKSDIEFAAARNLLSGTENTLFSPDSAITRGMLVTALGRLAGINPDSYPARSFTDVNANSYYGAYAEWAVQSGLVAGTGSALFTPDEPVTREQLAVIMANYAGQMGYSLPASLAATTFADSSQENATRAEASAALRRFVEAITGCAMSGS